MILPDYQSALMTLAAYVVGATPFGFLAGKMRGVDIREHGSGNIGATNVLRILGKPMGTVVLILDALKGLVPALVATLLFDDPWTPILAALATILGHNYTFWLGFKGGKGIATSAGTLLALMPIAAAAAIAVWIIIFFTTRYVSLSSISAAITVPVALGIQQAVTGNANGPLLGVAAFIGGLAVYRHKSNIKNLIAGTEHKFARKQP